jgi:hypothetical protein
MLLLPESILFLHLLEMSFGKGAKQVFEYDITYASFPIACTITAMFFALKILSKFSGASFHLNFISLVKF